nr:RraA family protein [Aquidulcibacter paucihalophilus]
MIYSEEILNKALAHGTATLFEAAELQSVSVDPFIRSVWPGAAVAGPAYPIECAPGDNLGIQIALERAPRGSVLVVDARGFIAGYWGEVLTVFAQAAVFLVLSLTAALETFSHSNHAAFLCLPGGYRFEVR